MSNRIQKFAIIVAGGTGSRMLNTLPKQYLSLDNIPILMYSIRAFHEQDPHTQIIVVISQQMLNYWQELCEKYHFKIQHDVVTGGKYRIESVYNALNHITDTYPDDYQNSLIAVHDGARPLVSISDIGHLYTVAKQRKSVVPAVQSTNSIRIGRLENNKTIDRNTVWQIQTPQVFDGKLLVSAYRSAMDHGEITVYTDDASVVEEMGNTIHLFPGDYRNIKITHPEDIGIALIYLKNQDLAFNLSRTSDQSQ